MTKYQILEIVALLVDLFLVYEGAKSVVSQLSSFFMALGATGKAEIETLKAKIAVIESKL